MRSGAAGRVCPRSPESALRQCYSTRTGRSTRASSRDCCSAGTTGPSISRSSLGHARALQRSPNQVNDSNPTSRLASLNVRFGLRALLHYLTIGLALEGLHGFKVSWYLDFETRRLLWTLAHAHGVLLSVLTVGLGMLLRVSPDPAGTWTRAATACLIAATILLPGGFLVGGI